MSRDQRRLWHWPISDEYSNFAKAKPERLSDDVTRKIGPLDFKDDDEELKIIWLIMVYNKFKTALQEVKDKERNNIIE